MKSQILGLRVACIIFGFLSIAQLARLIINPEILIVGYRLPLWPSALAVVILAGLCLWLFKLSRLKNKDKLP
jgi:hypothetical protein